MKDPVLTRRGNNGKLIAMDEIMAPAEALLNKRILQITRSVTFTWEDTQLRGLMDIISEALIYLDSVSNEPIKLIISCPGGSAYAIFALYDVIKSVDSPVWTFGRICYSGGALLLAAGEKGHRYVYPNSYSMLHPLQIYSRPGVTTTETDESRSSAFIEQESRMINLLIECGVNKPPKQIKKDIRADLYMDARETVAYGLADKVIRGGMLLDGE